jgi:hypothetical protein
MASNVPRVSDITGRKPAEDVRFEREWQRYWKDFRKDTDRWGYGSERAKEAWKRRIDRTRSF